jgi:hypothetical protein
MPNDDPLAPRTPRARVNREESNQRILSLIADFATAPNLLCRQAASPAAHFFVTHLIEIGASLPRERHAATADTLSLVDRITEKTIAGAIRQSSNRPLERTIECLSQFGFINLVVDARTLHHLKTVTKQDYARLFEDLIEIV